MRTFLASLSEHPLATLRAIANLRGVELVSNVRSEAAAQLAAALNEWESTAAALAGSSDAARAAWQTLRTAGSQMKYAVFTRTYGEIRPVGPGKLEREEVWRQPISPAEELWYLGLIYRVFADLGDGPLEYVYIPEDLTLPAPSAAPVPRRGLVSPAALDETPPRVHQALNTLAVDASAIFAALRESPAPCDRLGVIDKAYAEQLRVQLVTRDPDRLGFLIALLTSRGWIAIDRGRLVVDHERTGAWLRAAPWPQASTLFAAWRDSVEWNDLRRVPGLIAEGEWHNDPQLARRAVLDALKPLDPALWYRVDSFVTTIKATNPDFQRPDGGYTGWYLRDAESAQYLSGFEAWDKVEGRLIHFLIEGPLFWLGAVALGEWAVGEPVAFRLTSFGAAWLAKRMPKSLPRPARLSVGEDFVVTAPLFTPLLDRFRLLRMAETLPLQPSEAGRNAARLSGTRHQITRASLMRAREAGIKTEAALDFLRRATGNGVPPKVAAAISRFGEMGGEVRLTRGAVLRVADAAMLATLRADPAIGPLLGDLLSAQAVLVPDTHLVRLQTLLKESGYNVQLD
jgi:hypothetical protein